MNWYNVYSSLNTSGESDGTSLRTSSATVWAQFAYEAQTYPSWICGTLLPTGCYTISWRTNGHYVNLIISDIRCCKYSLIFSQATWPGYEIISWINKYGLQDIKRALARKHKHTKHGVFIFGIRIRMYSNTNFTVFVFEYIWEEKAKYSYSNTFYPEYFHKYFMNTC